MQLIPASEFSIDFLTEVYNETRIDYLVPMPMSARRMQEYIWVYDLSLEGSVVAMDGDDIYGLCMLGDRGDKAWITRLGVTPQSRRHGAGRAMMEHCIEEASHRNIPNVYLEVITGNDPAERLFESLGFNAVQTLLILRRAPHAAPHLDHVPPDPTLLDETALLECAAARSARPAWTNQTESLQNAGNTAGLHLHDEENNQSGWVSYKQSSMQLKRVIIEPDTGSDLPPASSLLWHLHTRFPGLDTIAENIPANAPYLHAFFEFDYVVSFSRIEMELKLSA